MPETRLFEAYHRFPIKDPDEPEKVRRSMEVWGTEANVLAGGLRVQAYPRKNTTVHSYSFGTKIPAYISYGFVNRKPVIREVYWTLDLDGVVERQNGDYVAVPIDWAEGPLHEK